MNNHVVFFFTSWLLCEYASSFEVHKDMTIEELKNTFHVDHHNLVPEYEVISIHHLHRRSIDSNPNTLNHFTGRQRSKNGERKPPPPFADIEYDQIGRTNATDSGQETVKAVNDDRDAVKAVDNSRDAVKAVDNGQDAVKAVGNGQGAVNGGQEAVKAVNDGQLTQLKLRAFGQPYNLTLTRNEGLIKKGKLKVWTVHPNATAQHGVEYVETPEEENEDIGELYQDEENLAAVLLRKEDGGLVVEGSIGSHLVIRPIPERLRGHVSKSSPTREELSLTENEELATGDELETNDKSSEVHHHIVYKRKPSQDDTMSDYALMEPDHISKRFRRSLNMTKNSRRKREAPYTIYPEILVIVDYDGYRLHDGDNVQIKRYFVSFWNGVDLRYKLLKGPKIRVSIAGIIISRGRDATPYLERNRVGRDAIDSAAALTDMGKYLFRERRLPVYDIAVAITKLDMCRKAHPNDVCNRGTAGFAYVGGACVVNKRLEKVNSVAIIEDTGGFSGIIVAAHEVGHLLGAVHDGSPPPSYLGGPGAEKCQWTDGYIMSDLRHTERGFRWSPCSVSSFHHFLNGDTATCLYNAPHEDEGLPRVLPGKLLTLDAQCRKDRGTSACFKDDRVCAQLFCFDSGSGYCVAYRPAAEGSPCGDGQFCLNGRCVAEHENIIPDYSQNQPSYIRSNGNQGRPLFYEEEETPKQADPQQPNTYNDPNYNQYNPNDHNYNQYYNQNDQNQYYNQNDQNQYTNNQNDQNQYTNQNDQNQYTNNQNDQNQYTNNQNDQNQYNRNPYDYYSTTAQPTQTTKAFGWFTISTTRSPYDFQNFGKSYFAQRTTTQVPNYYVRQTTKNPYDFADFGKTTRPPYGGDQLNNNYLKRSYDASSYYGESSRKVDTRIFPQANLKMAER